MSLGSDDRLSPAQIRAVEYIRRFGFAVIPLRPKSKAAAQKGWNDLVVKTEDDLRSVFSDPAGNIGVRCGEPSGGLMDVDLDDLVAVKLAPEYLPETRFKFGRKSKPASHWFYRCEGDLPEYFKGIGPDRTCLVELRCTGDQYTVLPDSIHDKTGEEYEFVIPPPRNRDDLTAVGGAELAIAVRELAAATVLAKLYPREAGMRHDIALALGGALARLGWSVEKAKNFLAPVFKLARDEEWDDRLVDVENSFARVAAGEAATGFPKLIELLGEGTKIFGKYLQVPRDEIGAADDEGERPVIEVRHEIAPMQQELESLLRGEGGFYRRAGQVVRIITDDLGREQIAPVTRATLKKFASEYRWTKTTKTGRSRRVAPDKSVLEALLDDPASKLPVLRGIVTTPTLLPDGTLLDSPGYDARSKTFYVPSIEFEEIPELVTKEDAEQLVDSIREVFRDFPFASRDADFAAVMGMILTQLLRHTIDGPVPMFLVRSPTAGSGKTLLVDIISIIATGEAALCHAYPGNEEELRKTLFSLALAGQQLVCFDNMTRTLKSATLCNYLTSRNFGARILTTMTANSAPATTVLYATGNNIGPVGDLVRRMVCVDLDPNHERPEFRGGFEHKNLRAFVREHRKKLVPALLSMIRAYLQAGSPEADCIPIGSYEQWTTIIRQPLIWLGVGDPAQKLVDARNEGDEEEGAKIALLRAWRSAFHAQEVKSLDLLSSEDFNLKLALVDCLRDATLDRFGNLTGVKASELGSFLASIKDRIFNASEDDEFLGLKVVREGRKKAGVKWKVVRVDEKGEVIKEIPPMRELKQEDEPPF